VWTGRLALPAPERAALAEAARRLSAVSSSPITPAGTSSPALVGRAHELALLERHLAGQGPPVVLLAGEPGIGETRLLHAAIQCAVSQGLRVLEGGLSAAGRPRALRPTPGGPAAPHPPRVTGTAAHRVGGLCLAGAPAARAGRWAHRALARLDAAPGGRAPYTQGSRYRAGVTV
jgi:hypothetical protein